MLEPKVFKGDDGQVYEVTSFEPITVDQVNEKIAHHQTKIDYLNQLKAKVEAQTAPAQPAPAPQPAPQAPAPAEVAPQTPIQTQPTNPDAPTDDANPPGFTTPPISA